MTKKNDSWVATIRASCEDSRSLVASLACEDVEYHIIDKDDFLVKIHGKSASDLRAKYNSTMRSLRAASEILETIGG
ncbi:MAG: hypothetical protein VYA86_01230 [Candidatus Thermoplasmatota archaeon]|nr:hypothetical protein [Candidatus Thermoplasmatota archaeon]